jgi:IS605 OrfB family transposase
MKIISSYKVKIKNYSNIFLDTVEIYRRAVEFFIKVCDKEWSILECLKGKDRNGLIEKLTLATERNKQPKYSFNGNFYKMPAYLRRAAINCAIGAYSSYDSSLKNWKKSNKKGKKPTLNTQRNVMPVLYKGRMFKDLIENTAKIKIYHKKDWVWVNLELKKQDIGYLTKQNIDLKELTPTLKKSGKQWYLVFPLEQEVKFIDKPIQEKTICSVDLGINNSAVCSIIYSDGTVTERKFIRFPVEKDRLNTSLGRVKKAQQSGNFKVPIKWKHANDLNREISRKTAREIINFAVDNKVDVIVFEFLDMKGKKRGSKKQRLHLWRKQEIQHIVEHNAHRNAIRISHVCAWNTSKLAYDGSGEVERDKTNYSMCTFKSGKQYHADLNASYNIGARYFIRELLKSIPENSKGLMVGLPYESNIDGAKVLRYGTGTTRTLFTLRGLYADLQQAKAM